MSDNNDKQCCPKTLEQVCNWVKDHNKRSLSHTIILIALAIPSAVVVYFFAPFLLPGGIYASTGFAFVYFAAICALLYLF